MACWNSARVAGGICDQLLLGYTERVADGKSAGTHLRMGDRAVRVEDGANRVVVRVNGERFRVLFNRVGVARGVEGVVAGLLECRDARDAVEERAAKSRCARDERIFVLTEPMLKTKTPPLPR